MKKWLKILSIGAASLVVIGLGAVIVLTSSPGETLVKGWLEDQLTARIGLPVSIQRFETNLWSRVQIDTLIVSPSADLEKQPVLYVGQIRVGYSILQLLGETVALKMLSVDSVALGVELDSLGRYGVPLLDNPAPAVEDSTEKAGVICIDTVSLNRISLLYLDPQTPLTVELTGAVLSARGSRAGAFSGRLSVSRILSLYDSLAFNFTDLEVAASLDGEQLRIDRAQVGHEELRLEASGDIGIAETKSLDLVVSAEGSLDTLASDIAAAFDLPFLKAGRVSARCQIEGTVDDPDIKLHADLSDLVLQDVTIQSTMLEAKYHDDLLRVDSLRATMLGGTIRGDIGTVLDSLGATSLNVTIDRLGLSPLWQSIYAEPSPYRGTLNGRISAQGHVSDFTSWTIEAAIAGEDLHYLSRSIPDLQCFAKSVSGITGLSILHGSDTINADLELAEDSLRGTFEVTVPDLTALARFLDQPELSGYLWAKGTIDGTYSNPAFRSTVDGSRISYRNFPVDSIHAELSYEDSSFSVIDFVCEGRLDSVDSQHPPFGIDSLAGSVAYECRLRGPLDSLWGDILAHVDKPAYGSYAIDSLSAAATLNGSRLTITELSASRGGLGALLRATYDTSAASGSFDLLLHRIPSPFDSGVEPAGSSLEARGDFGSIHGEFALGARSNLSATVHGQGLWLGLLSMVTDDTTVTDGEMSFDLAVDGPYLTPEAVLSATARSVRISEYQIDSVSTHLRLDEESLSLDSLIFYALNHRLRATGRLELGSSPDGLFEITDSASVTAELSTEGFDLSVLGDLMLPDGELAGTVSAYLRVRGTVAVPRLDGWLTAENSRILLAPGSLPLENVGLSLLFADSILTIDSATGTVSNMAVAASGSVMSSTYQSASVDLNVNVGALGKLTVDGSLSDTSLNLQVLSDSLNLAVFQPFMVELDSLAGRLSCRMLISGRPAAPEVDGSLQISALAFQMPRHHTKLADGYAEVRFDRNRVILDSALASLNNGRVAASGVFVHDQGTPVDLGLTLWAGSMTLQDPETYIIKVDSAALTYGKRQESYVLDGDIVLGETRLTAGFRPTVILPWVQTLETVDLELPELVARSRLDVRIRESDNLWVDNNLARIRLRAELGVIGTALRPNLTGLLQVEEGYLLYLDRRFRVNEGSVYFNDPARFNPDINLDASTEVTVYRRTAAEPYTVYIKAEGLLDQLQYGLYSEPPLDQPDIVALLTLGATRTELTGGEGEAGSGITGVLKDRAAMLTSQRVSGYLSRRAGSLFGFDEFTIQGNLFQFNNAWGPQLVASKHLSRRVDLTYSTTVGHLNDQTVRLGYRLTPRFSLQGETDRQGRAGIDLKYGFTFK